MKDSQPLWMVPKNKTITIKTERLYSANEHVKKPDECWQHILWSDETRINESGPDAVQHVWRGPDQEHYSDCSVPAVKQGGADTGLRESSECGGGGIL